MNLHRRPQPHWDREPSGSLKAVAETAEDESRTARDPSGASSQTDSPVFKSGLLDCDKVDPFQEPLPPYELDPRFSSMVRRPVGDLITRAMKIRSDEDGGS